MTENDDVFFEPFYIGRYDYRYNVMIIIVFDKQKSRYTMIIIVFSF